jgi:UDP-glucose 6-dehydrogenase
MLANNWINSKHTQVPGPDGLLSYGGSCFPKDTNAFLKYMKKYGTPSKVLEATTIERNEMRPDKTNIID